MRKTILLFVFFLFIQLNGAYSETLELYLFASSTCQECIYLKQKVFPAIIKKYNGKVRFTHIKVDDVDSFELQLAYEEAYDINDNSSIKLFVGNQCLCGKSGIISDIEHVIEAELSQENRTLTPDNIRKREIQTNDILRKKFNTVSTSIIFLSGLIDGVNPCAFVTLVFFISALSVLGKSRKDILLVGIIFSFSVFLTYFLIGLGCLSILREMSMDSSLFKIANFATALLCFFLACLSLYDSIQCFYSGKADKITMKLPVRIRRIINRLIYKKIKTAHVLLWAFFLGFIVSLLETVCTGQIYLPTIIYTIRQGNSPFTGAVYLFLYNLGFIIPLLLVFILVYSGLSVQKIKSFFNRNIALSKLVMACLFILLGVVLLLNNTN